MKTEIKEMVSVGEIIPCINPDGKIASWKRGDGSIFTKISKENTIESRWTAVENPQYRSRGLIVFLDKHPKEKESIKIVKTGKSYTIGVVCR